MQAAIAMSKVRISKSHTKIQSRLISRRDCSAPTTRARSDGSLKDVGSQVNPVWLEVLVGGSRGLGSAYGEKCMNGIQECAQIWSDIVWQPPTSSWAMVDSVCKHNRGANSIPLSSRTKLGQKFRRAELVKAAKFRRAALVKAAIALALNGRAVRIGLRIGSGCD